MLFNTHADIAKSILSTKIPAPFSIENPSQPSEKINAYNLNQPDDFLDLIIYQYVDELEKIPFSSHEDQQAYEKALAVIRDIKKKGKKLLDFAKEIRQVLCDDNANYFSIGVVLGKSMLTGSMNNEIGKTFKSFRHEKGNNADTLNALPEIKGSRSYLLAFLYSCYLEMSAQTFVLNAENNGLEEIPARLRMWRLVSVDTKTSEQAGKNSFGIDCDERRRIVSSRHQALIDELDRNKKFIPPQESVEPKADAISSSLEINSSFQAKNESDEVIQKRVNELILQIDNFIGKLTDQHDIVNEIYKKLRDKLEFFDFIDECLTNKNNQISPKTLTEWHKFFINEIKQSGYASEDVIEFFSRHWTDITKDFVQTSTEENKGILSYLRSLFVSAPLFSAAEIQTKIKNEKAKIIDDLSDIAKTLQEQQLLIKKVTELRDKLKRSWSCYFRNHRNAIIGLEKIITNISTNEYFLISHPSTINEIKTNLIKFTQHLNDFSHWENKIFRNSTSEQATKWLEDKAKPQSRWKNFSSMSSMFALGKVKQAFSCSATAPVRKCSIS